MFTAPLHGLYYFRFTAFHSRDKKMGVHLYHNDRWILYNVITMDGPGAYLSNAVALKLQRGDQVYMTLAADTRLYDSSSKHNTFTGFLIFPM